jgi:hypothetical protein
MLASFSFSSSSDIDGWDLPYAALIKLNPNQVKTRIWSNKICQAILTLKESKGNCEQGAEEHSESEQCTESNPIPLGLGKDTTGLQNLNAKGLIGHGVIYNFIPAVAQELIDCNGILCVHQGGNPVAPDPPFLHIVCKFK